METNIKRSVVKILSAIPLAIGVIAAVLALTGWGNIEVLLALLGIGLFSGAMGELIND